MRISDWSSDLCSSDLGGPRGYDAGKKVMGRKRHAMVDTDGRALELLIHAGDVQDRDGAIPLLQQSRHRHRSEEHTSELQSLMRTSYAVFCVNKNKNLHQKSASNSLRYRHDSPQ